MVTQPRRFEIAPCPQPQVRELARELGVSEALAQVLVRRGLADPERARAFLAAEEEHPPTRVRGHRGRASRRFTPTCARAPGSPCTATTTWTAICSTAVLVRALRRAGADVDWYLPDRASDGYGLNARTVQRLAARGTRLLVTADCGITAVEEVRARAGGRDGGRGQRPPRPARGRSVAAGADRAPGGVRVPVPGPVRDRRRLQARAGAVRRRGCRAARPRARTSTWWRWRPSPTWCRCWARTAPWCAADCGRWRAPPSRACAR